MQKQTPPTCRICGKPLSLIDTQEQRWYCYKDDQVYFAEQNHWGRLPGSDSPVFRPRSDASSPTENLPIVLGGAALLLVIFGVGKAMLDYGACQNAGGGTESCSGLNGSGCYPGIPWSWNAYLGFHPEVLVSITIGIILAILAAVTLVINPVKKTSEPLRAKPEVQRSQPHTESSMMFCRKCGAKIPRDSKFCKECGNMLT